MQTKLLEAHRQATRGLDNTQAMTDDGVRSANRVIEGRQNEICNIRFSHYFDLHFIPDYAP